MWREDTGALHRLGLPTCAMKLSPLASDMTYQVFRICNLFSVVGT